MNLLWRPSRTEIVCFDQDWAVSYIVLDIWVAIRSFISQRKWGFKNGNCSQTFLHKLFFCYLSIAIHVNRIPGKIKTHAISFFPLEHSPPATWSLESTRPSCPGRPGVQRAGRGRSLNPWGNFFPQYFWNIFRPSLLIRKTETLVKTFQVSSLTNRITWVHPHRWSRHRPRQKLWRSS